MWDAPPPSTKSRTATVEAPSKADVGFGRAAARGAGVGWDVHSLASCLRPFQSSFGPARYGPDLKTLVRGGVSAAGELTIHPSQFFLKKIFQ